MKNSRDLLLTLCSGTLFGLGLAWSTMIRPESILDFLAFNDLGLLLVLGGAVGLNLLVYPLWPRFFPRTWLGGSYQTRPFALSRETAIGGVIFGLGWGLCGVCPGPALAALGAGQTNLLPALGGILAGALLHGLWVDLRARHSQRKRK